MEIFFSNHTMKAMLYLNSKDYIFIVCSRNLDFLTDFHHYFSDKHNSIIFFSGILQYDPRFFRK